MALGMPQCQRDSGLGGGPGNVVTFPRKPSSTLELDCAAKTSARFRASGQKEPRFLSDPSYFKNRGHQAVCTDSLSTQLCGLGTMETSLSRGEMAEDHYQGQRPEDGRLTLEQLVLGLRKGNMEILCLPPES